jgi:glycosyltransferase involved in cell wall biosynthesis
MNVAYVVWLENLSSPILTGQVVDVLAEMGRLSEEHNLHLFAFQPLYRMLLRRDNLAEVHRRLRAAGVRTTWIPCLAIPQVDLFRVPWYMMPVILLQSVPALLLLTVWRRIDILHCRSYPATWAASVLRPLLAAKVIFDPRSDFPEENITAGKWAAGSATDRAWKRLESRLLEDADATVAITESYVDHYSRVAPEARFYLVPNNVDTQRFRRDEIFRESFRSKHDLGADTVVFCYNGSMGGHWNSPEPYADFILRLRDLGTAHWFLFITPDAQAVTHALGLRGLTQDEFGVVSCAFEDVPKYLSVADIGMMFVEEERIALGIKTVEYLAAGMPVIANGKALGAAEVVTRYGVGLVVADSGAADLEEIRKLAGRREEISSACRHLAETRFSTSKVAERYLQLYDTLAQP